MCADSFFPRRLMQTGFNRTIFAATQRSSLSKNFSGGRFSFLGTMSNRSVKSSDSVKSLKIDADNVGDQMFQTASAEQSRQRMTTEASFDEEYPSLSASMSFEPKRKRRMRVDLGPNIEKKLEKEQLDQASFEISDPRNSDLPTRFGNKCGLSTSKVPKFERNSMLSPGSSIDQPFDICIRKATEQKPRKGSLLKMWVPKEQWNAANSFEETGQVLRPGYKDGAKLRLFMMCLGLDWDPQTRAYAEIRRHDNVVPPSIPSHFSSVVAKALNDSHRLPTQDRDETEDSLQKGLPVVSISIGDSAEFLYGNQRDVDKADSLLLESGDVLIFGGKSRHIFHGVTNIYPKTAPPELLEKTGLRPGRLNLTFRKY